MALAAAWQWGQWGWIEAKAWLAAGLIERAWQARLAGAEEGAARPWPWADTWPVARLRVPRLGVERLVLHGASGRTLAFGPGWDSGSADPGRSGSVLVSGHRDTHFRFLAELRAGDTIELEHPAGRDLYRVEGAQVFSAAAARLVDPGDRDLLWLVTCYPFSALRPGGDLRYLVSAQRVAEAAAVAGRG
ncbi:MAG TPA: class GN sortase [Gammaproteobacteria bacterium]